MLSHHTISSSALMTAIELIELFNWQLTPEKRKEYEEKSQIVLKELRAALSSTNAEFEHE